MAPALFFLLALGAHLACWALLGLGLRRVRRPPPPAPAAEPSLSVVVAARNEARRLPALLEALARQTHPRFEVLVVDDGSTDGTLALARAWAARDPRVRPLALPPDPAVRARKKRALTHGIAAARFERLALTDADCAPPPEWLRLTAAAAEAEPDAVLIGYGPYRPGPGLLNRLVRYETLVTGLLAAAAAGLGRPYMAVGRNLSYPKALFGRIGGFAHSMASLSGDDDLLVQEVRRRRAAPVRFVLDPRHFVPSDAPASWRAWLRQKRRHGSAGRFYDPAATLGLALFHGTGLAAWTAPFWLGPAGLLLPAAKLLAQALVLRPAGRAFAEPGLLPLLPLLDALYLLHVTLVLPLGALAKPGRW